MRQLISCLCIVIIVAISLCHGGGLTGSESDACVEAHNLLRMLHPETEPLSWDSGLASNAQKWADHLLKNNMFDHDPKNQERKEGENLYTFFGPAIMTCAHAVQDWYNEVHDYDFDRGKAKNSWKTLIEEKENDNSTRRSAFKKHHLKLAKNHSKAEKRGNRGKMIGHFTQIVWKGTSKVGVAISSKFVKREYDIDYYKSYVVARYKNPGNYRNQYTENVLGGAPVDIPELHELDSAACKNSLSESKCNSLMGQFGCESSAWRCFMLAGCYKKCTSC